MLRWVGVLAIFSACAGMGFHLSERLAARIICMEQLYDMLQHIRGQMRCTLQPLPELFLAVAGESRPPVDDFLRKLSLDMDKQESLPLSELWSRHLNMAGFQKLLEEEDFRRLELLGSELGRLDLQMQENLLALFSERWETKLSRLRAAAVQDRRICCRLGIGLGLLVPILLL